MTCEGLWALSCDNGLISGSRIKPRGSLIYHINDEDPSFNDRWFSDNPEVCSEISVSKKDFESVDWPTWLESGEIIYIQIYASGNYTIEEK